MAISSLEPLVRVVREHSLERKLLLCQGYAEGHQLQEQLCRSIGPVLNLEVQTLRGLVMDRTRLELSKRDITPVSPADTYWITYALLQDTIVKQPGFLTKEQLTPGVIQVFHRALQELREAGIKVERLKEDYFENPAKGRFVRSLLQGYENLLCERKLADYAALVSMLPEAALIQEIVVAQETIVSSWADRLAFERLSGGRGVLLLQGLPFTHEESSFPLMTSTIFQANGVLSEVREVFRRMLEQNIPWDQTEIILSDYAGAASAVQTTAEQIEAACTYAEGLPIRFSTVGRAALHLLDWVESDYHAEHLITAFREGLLGLWEERVSSSAAVKALEESGIGWGRDRYALLNQAKDWTSDETLWNACEGLGGIVEACFKNISAGNDCSPGHILKALCSVLEKAAGASSVPEERLVLTQIQELHHSSSYVSAVSIPLASAVRMVRELIEALSFRVSGIPAEGAVYISSLNSGGFSGRPYTFVIGMDDPTWRINPKQDPVLLDEERSRISPELIRSSEKAELVHEKRLGQMGAVGSSCTLSYSAFDLTERREQYPAYELLQVFRLQTGKMEADFEELKDHLGALVRYSPSNDRSAIDGADIWMKHLVTAQAQIRDGISSLYNEYENLKHGAVACESRENCAEITVYDGIMDTSLHRIEFVADGTGKALSASRLELYARCPMQFYFQEVLRLRVKEIPEFDRTRWLDAMERGSLLHEIFQKYYAPWTEQENDEMELVHDREFLKRITEDTLDDYAKRIPAPSPHVREKESDSIRRDADIFFRQEQSRSSRPLYLELQLHKEEEPFQLELSEELTLPLRGFVDRVDRVGPHQYRIVDYKTGKPAKYKEQEYFAGGTQLQHALYAMAVEQWLKQSGADPEAQVEEAAYVFPTEKGLGEEIVRLQNRKEKLVELLRSLLGSMGSGVFPPTREPSNCSYCDYAEACGNHAVWMKDKSGDRLQQLQEVYSHA